MNNLMRTAVCALVLGLLALGFFTIRCTYSPGDLQEMIRRSEEIHRLERAMLRRHQAMRQAAQACIAQRCTLAETIQRWQELEQEMGQELPFYSVILRQHPIPTSDEERHYGGILANIEAILRGQPEELAAVLRRLEKEYQQLLADRNRPSAMPMKRTELSR
jgi:hypothetical protein